MGGMHVKFEISPEEFLGNLTQAAYQVMVKNGFQKPFIEVELELWDVLREVIRRNMQVSPQCGSHRLGVCDMAERYEPWSKEADAIDGERGEAISDIS